MKEETIKKVLEFRDKRNWLQFHNPKDLAISISLEAAELLEIFQWSGNDLVVKERITEVEDELADILNYCILMADVYDIDIDKIICNKVNKNNEKYPVDKSFNSNKKYTKI